MFSIMPSTEIAQTADETMLMCRPVCTFAGGHKVAGLWTDSNRLLDVYWASAMEGKTQLLGMFFV